jgi:hypothetical protein
MKISPQKKQVCEKWDPPPPRFLKINFDGASKGNPGLAGAGGIFWDSTGVI